MQFSIIIALAAFNVFSVSSLTFQQQLDSAMSIEWTVLNASILLRFKVSVT